MDAVTGGTGNATSSNSGSVGGEVAAITTTGNATATNSGAVGGQLIAITTTGNATATNSGSVGSQVAAITTTGNATATNSGAVGGQLVAITVTGNATATNSGSVGDQVAAITTIGNATATNSGSVGSQLVAITNTGDATAINSGSVSNQVEATTSIGNATVTNSGSAGSQVVANTTIGNATATNSGSVSGQLLALTTTGNATAVNSGSVGGELLANTITGNAIVINSGSVAGLAEAIVNNTGNAAIVNFGTFGNGVVVFTNSGNATLTSYAGSSISGSIIVAAGTGTTTANFFGGNYLYTFSAPGVPNVINTNGAPFVVSGNSVAVLDPTALALQDRSVMQFTAGVSSMLQDRFGGMPIAGGPTGGALGFAPTAAGVVAAAHDAFSGLPSVAMSYSSARANNAYAMFTKAPPPGVPVYDTVVWTSGFGGERTQLATGSILGARDRAFGGAIGADRQLTSDLRLGALVGAGSSRMQVDFDVQRIDSDYVFGGGYGRFDWHHAYVDFALFGGRLSNKSQRNIANNLVANGFEQATASYNGWFISPDVTYGYRIFMGGDTIVTPKARVRYVGGSLDAYTENGSAQGLSIGKRNLSDIEERLGVEFARVVPALISGTLKASVDISGVGLQRLGDTTINGVLLAQNIAFTTPGKNEAYGGALNLGIDWRPKSNISLYASGEGTAMSDRSRSVTGKGGVRIGF